MLEGTTKTINGRKWTIGALPVDLAFEVGCLVMEWRGRFLQDAGPAAAGPQTLADLKGDGEVTPEAVKALVWEQMRSLGSLTTLTGKMLRDPEYRRDVWLRCLSVCLCEHRPVVSDNGKFLLDSADLADAFEAHQAVIDHNCGPFLAGFGLAGRPHPSSPQSP